MLVVLGAGASFDSVSPTSLVPGVGDAWRPPLAQGLLEPRPYSFAPLLSNYPEMAALVVELRERLDRGEDLETMLAYFQALAADGDVPTARALMSLRFYLQQIIESCSAWGSQHFGATNYVWLVNRLDRWAKRSAETVLYVTFNYDTLLDQAFSTYFGMQLAHLEDYVAQPSAKLFKPHGSVNWSQRFSYTDPHRFTARSWAVEHATSLELGPIELHLGNDDEAGVGRVPALAVPVRNKHSFVCPPEHLQVLRQQLGTVDRILIIGWRATEEHFLRLICEAVPKTIRLMATACFDQEAELEICQRVANAAALEVDEVAASGVEFSRLKTHPAFEQLLV